MEQDKTRNFPQSGMEKAAMAAAIFILSAADRFLELAVRVTLILCLLAGSLYLYDSRMILEDAAAGNLFQYRPAPAEAGEEPSWTFEELRGLVPDVNAWLTIEGTGIDYPIVQGTDNIFYVNHDITGEYSLAGSIFLDAGNASGFSDEYNLVYGHHMDKGLMFGALDEFLDTQYLETHRQGELLLPDRTLRLTVLAAVATDAYDGTFYPESVSTRTKAEIFSELEQCGTDIQELAGPDSRLVALSTCLDEGTGRLVVLLALSENGENE